MSRYASIKIDCRATGSQELIVRYRSWGGRFVEWHTGNATVAAGQDRIAADDALFARYGKANVTIYTR